MKKSQHGNNYLHEIQGKMIAGKMMTAEATDYNLFAAISEVLDKLMNEAEHQQRTNRQRK